METIKAFLCMIALVLFIAFVINVIYLIWHFEIYNIKMTITAFILWIVVQLIANELLKDE